VSELTREAFDRVDLRVATVLAAERVAGTDRLIRLEIRIGTEERQIVAGIGASYAPEDLPGRQIVVVANLKPAVIRGVESRGMLLAAVDGGDSVLLGPDKAIADGTEVS
jgi:methionyl-tRNA synthetase